MAGLAATRLFAAAGAGGVALTAWALRRSGMEPRLVAWRMVAFMVLLYVDLRGLADRSRHRPGDRAVPGRRLVRDHDRAGDRRAACCSPGAGAMALLPGDLERRLQRSASGSGRSAHCVARAVTVPALAASGVRTALELIRERDPGLLGAVAWWGFDISVLWAMFHAFGSPPPFAVIWMSYFVGMLGNLLPLPGGLGGVEGGMIGAFAAFGVNVEPRGARGAVLPRDLVLAADAAGRDRLLPAARNGRALARAGRRARCAPARREAALQRVLSVAKIQPARCYTLESKVTRRR